MTIASNIEIVIGTFTLQARLELELAPLTCKAIQKILPLKSKIIQARWSGESAWVPMGDKNLLLKNENALHSPEPGQILFHSGDEISETEMLFPYGLTRFACRNGDLTGNHFATIQTDSEKLKLIGEKILWGGAAEFSIRMLD